jgi:hypothetical protein
MIVFVSSVVDRGFEPLSHQPKDYKIDACSFSVKHVALNSKCKHWFAQSQNNVHEWRNVYRQNFISVN